MLEFKKLNGAMEARDHLKNVASLKNTKFFSIIAMAALFVLMTTDAFSQVQGKWRGGMDVGVGSIFPKKGYRSLVSPTFDWSIGYNPHKNMNVGFKLGYVMALDNYSGREDCHILNLNFTATYTYYFGKRTNLFIPFVGGGIGYYFLDTWVLYQEPENVYGFDISYSYSENQHKFGGFFTAGLEIGKFRLAAKWELLPASKLTLYNYSYGNTRYVERKFRNSYWTVSAGFYLGGGNRRKAALVLNPEEATASEREKIEEAIAWEKERAEKPKAVLKRGEAALKQEKAALELERKKLALERERAAIERERAILEGKEIPIQEKTETQEPKKIEKTEIQDTVKTEQVVSPSVATSACDVILLKDGQEIKATVTEITPSEIKYKAYENPNGPTRTLWKNDVFVINYADGTREVIGTASANNNSSSSVSNKAGQVSIGLSPVMGINRLVYISTNNTAKIFVNLGFCGKFRVGVANPIRLEASFTYYLPRTVDISGIDIKYNVWDVGLNMQLIFAKRDKFIPYPLVGFGGIGEKLSALGESGKAAAFGFNFGGGFDVKLSNVVFFNTEAKYMLVISKEGGVGGRAAVSAGLIFRF